MTLTDEEKKKVKQEEVCQVSVEDLWGAQISENDREDIEDKKRVKAGTNT